MLLVIWREFPIFWCVVWVGIRYDDLQDDLLVWHTPRHFWISEVVQICPNSTIRNQIHHPLDHRRPVSSESLRPLFLPLKIVPGLKPLQILVEIIGGNWVF